MASSYEPLGTCTWRRAVTLWYLGKISVEAEFDAEVNSVSFTMKTPAVIRYLQNPGFGRRRIRMSRENIYLRDGGICQYCGNKVSRGAATFDHVIPRAQGGTSDWGNLTLACYGCNKKKAARTPEEAGMKLRSKPARPTKIAEVWSITADPDNTPPQWTEYLRNFGYWNAEVEKG